MRITLRQLKRLLVETKSGKKLGHVCNVIFEIDGQLVAQYEVTPSLLSGKKYLISRDQVVSISAEKMVVSDGVVVVGVEEKGGERMAATVEPVVMREAKNSPNHCDFPPRRRAREVLVGVSRTHPLPLSERGV